MKKVACICLIGIIFLVSIGLVNKVYAESQEIVSPKDFGRGVYYFSVVTWPLDNSWRHWASSLPTSKDPDIFGKSLAAFKAKNPNLVVTGIASRSFNVGDFNYTVGYWVNFEKK